MAYKEKISQARFEEMIAEGKPRVFSKERPDEATANGRHLCVAPKRAEGERGEWGEAVEFCQEAPNGTFFVANVEYESKVDFCPFCGEKSKNPG